MTSITLLGEAQLRELVPLDLAAIDQIEAAFLALATEDVAMPPVLRLDLPAHNGEVDVKTAWLPRFDSFAIKVSPGFFDNPALGLPSLNGLMLVLSAKTGLTKAVLLDNGYLTAVRTAAAGAVAARWLARQQTPQVAVLGAGEQARLQLQALMLVRHVEHVRVWARNSSNAQRFAEETTATLGVRCEAARDVAHALAEADVAITTTPSRTPLIEEKHLHTGLHTTAMGSDAEHKNEIAPAALAAARYICDRVQQTRVLGELHHALVARAIKADAGIVELGEVIAGKAVGRASDADVTLCDLTGTGAQDTAIAALALQRARDATAGMIFRNDVLR
ncbi:MAG: Ectoine utilization protein EutC, similar to ornithine cyclodeaminase [uncultured Paraburkholderia sp.]|nr:MAG: Ectoine utilization protein EutC, similar to ornithine cyclodeaminase [uncultured Paraburkholderia sp.]CAH2799598.1 MAG: Ectoine utilization protein EutC, similar to ornithine cyclodeaminase [uncultured Paraburkholderia sp.]CAH2933706.1 MAG: Ectoine utilization protein EutC, similar to ornithine cyclodeaminase [uncultured Paraburkholderia sp.]CAH2935363.1 MAG: Ectoine utilization protein EutC, similar to ornithine cyclodeaminase [uncultured Paraburkholderia sp.]